MPALKAASLRSFLRRDVNSAAGVLVYGPDRGRVREHAVEIATAVAGSGDNPFALLKLDESDLAADPGRLPDEIQSPSLLGGRRVIWIENAGNALAASIAPFDDARPVGNLVVAEAGNLAKSAKLRVLFERGNRLWSLPCYEDSASDLQGLIDEELGSHGLDISDDAREALAALLGADRRLSRQELAKLALYCHGKTRVELADVEAICGEVTGFTADDLIHAAFGGDLGEASRLFHRLVQSGTAVSSLLTMALGHSARLMRFRVEMGRGKSAETVLGGARPPIYFKSKAALLRELGLWDDEALLSASRLLSGAIRDTRERSTLEEQIAERAFLSLARTALQQRRAA